jgi:predicted lipoprotein with Yx(FWY)xxD motif
MRVSRRALLAGSSSTIVAATAGCLTGGGDGTATDPDDTEAPTDDDGGTTTDGGGATVQVRAHDEHGDILVDGEGISLYMFDSDTQGEGASTCYDSCASNWPPLTVDGDATAGDGVTAELSTFERDDGAMQVAADGWPLYYYAGDSSPGDVTGQGVGGVWWLLRPDGSLVKPNGGDETTTETETDTETETETATPEPAVQVRAHDEHGDILVGADDMTLYMFDQDTQGSGSSSCHDSCASNWPPLTVEGDAMAGDGVTADLSTFEREDGSMQVAANGWPLYYYAGDSDPGDATGQGAGGVWWVLDPDGVPVKPDDDGGTTTDGDDGTTTDGGGGGGGGGGGYDIQPL